MKNLETYLVFGLIVVLVVMFFVVNAKAEFKFEYPAETNVTAFWFPSDNSLAAGVSHTVLRIRHTDIDKFSLDLDGTLAKEINAEKDNLIGIGIKLNYNIAKVDKTGFTFIPSLGITALNNIKNFKSVLQDYRIAIYGTAIMYRW